METPIQEFVGGIFHSRDLGAGVKSFNTITPFEAAQLVKHAFSNLGVKINLSSVANY